jgi:sec-independent protein translocase protein TatB
MVLEVMRTIAHPALQLAQPLVARAQLGVPDTLFIFVVALVVFGPKRLPEIGRQLGKLVSEFRRASNDFKLQIEEELRLAEQQEKQKQLEAQAAEPIAASAHPAPIEASEAGLLVRPPSSGTLVEGRPPNRPVPNPGLMTPLPVEEIQGAPEDGSANGAGLAAPSHATQAAAEGASAMDDRHG